MKQSMPASWEAACQLPLRRRMRLWLPPRPLLVELTRSRGHQILREGGVQMGKTRGPRPMSVIFRSFSADR